MVSEGWGQLRRSLHFNTWINTCLAWTPVVTDIHTGPICLRPMDPDLVIGSRLGPIVTIALGSNADLSDLDGSSGRLVQG